MTLCSDNHEEVCYEGRNCPACSALDDFRDAENEIEKLNKTIEEMREEIQQMKEIA